MEQCVFCKAKSTTNGDLTFHPFPKDKAKLKLWIENMGIKEDWKPLKTHSLCSKHFTKECYRGDHLKKASIPTIFDDSEKLDIEVVVDIIKEEELVEAKPTNSKAHSHYEGVVVKQEVESNYDNFAVTVDGETIGEDPLNIDAQVPHFLAPEVRNAVPSIQDIMNSYQKLQATYSALEAANFPNICQYGPPRKARKVRTKHSKASSAGLFICDICNKPYKNKSTLIRHIVNHTQNLHNCSYCIFVGYSKRSLSGHIKANHSECISYDCPYCPYKASRKDNLGRHVNSKHTKTTVFHCPYCNHEAYHRVDLNHHINAKHTQSMSFNCPDCSYKTYYKKDLKTHVNAKHTKTIVFYCTYCEYKAYHKNDLTQHINAKHTQDTVFMCSCCSYKTYYKKDLNKHVNAKHTKNYDFNCTYCSYGTYSKTELDRHINAKHTKAEVFYCTICTYKTYYRSGLNKHIKAKHSNTLNQGNPGNSS